MKSRRSKTGPRSKPSRAVPIVVSSPPAEPRPNNKLPPWDRTVDIVYPMAPHGHDAGPDEHEKRLSCFLASHGRPPEQTHEATLWTRLPPAIRQRICRLVLRSHQGCLGSPPVTLSRRCFTRHAWSRHDLVSLHSAMLPLRPCLAASFTLSADMMLALLSLHTFHVVLSPFVGPRLSPLATLWLNKYGPFMRNLIIEIDMTCLGLGPAPAAAGLHSGLQRLETLLHHLVTSQLRRHASLPLESLVLLCRRFHGTRAASATATEPPSRTSCTSSTSLQSQQSFKTKPSTHTGASSTQSPEALSPSPNQQFPVSAPDQQQQPSREYCPETCLHICDQLAPLRNRIKSIRLCGFSNTYAHHLIQSLFPDSQPSSCYRVAPSTAWPLLPGHKSYVDSGQYGRIVLQDCEA